MAWFEVTVTASCLVAVEAKDADEALDLAYPEAFCGSECGTKDADGAVERKTQEDIERLRRHADLDLPDED